MTNDNLPTKEPITLVNEQELIATKTMLEMAMLDLKHWHDAYYRLQEAHVKLLEKLVNEENA